MPRRDELLELLRPPPHRGPLIAAGAVLFTAGTFVWTSLLLFGAALYPAVRRNSAICGMVAGIALAVAILAAANWIFGADSQTSYRWLLLVLAIAYVLASLVLRGGSPRHAELIVIVAGLATLAIVLLAAQLAVF